MTYVVEKQRELLKQYYLDYKWQKPIQTSQKQVMVWIWPEVPDPWLEEAIEGF